jgi:hypothetical protein
MASKKNEDKWKLRIGVRHYQHRETRVKKQNTKKLQWLKKSPQLAHFFIKFTDLVNLRNGLLTHDVSSHGRGKLERGKLQLRASRHCDQSF